jgi:4,5-DOPA dioxygenase extradiol
MNNTLMPVLFLGHGSPMNAIEENEFSRAWQEAAGQIPRPQAILCISAHWETRGTQVTAMEQPRTIHDFFGFPDELFRKQYPAPGSPSHANIVVQLIGETKVACDHTWGLDHGTWSVLCRMYPAADIPVVQLSLDRNLEPVAHYQLASLLKPLRQSGVLVIGSGNIVHNLRVLVWEDRAFDWAVEYDQQVKHWILEDDHAPVIDYVQNGQAALLSVNTAEHYLPLLYTLGLKDKGEQVSFFAEKVTYGSLSMRCIRIG